MVLAILDVEHLSAMTAGDGALQREVADLFFAQAESWDAALVRAAPDSDWKIIAHTMKGSARGLGLPRLAAACERAEIASQSGMSAADLSDLRDALSEASAALRAHLAAP